MVPYLPMYYVHFFPLKKLGKLRCVLYIEFFVLESLIRLREICPHVIVVIKELEAVDGWRYPWFYSGWPPKESIGCGMRCIVLHFRVDDPWVTLVWVYPNHDFFTRALPTHFPCFLLFFPFFFLSAVQNRGAYYTWRTLFTGKYGIKLLQKRLSRKSKSP